MNFDHDSFMPNGRLRYLEYALEMIKKGSTAVGVSTTNCIVLVTQRQIVSPLMIEKKVDKIMKIDLHIGCLMSGVIDEGHQIIQQTRLKNQAHWFDYNEAMPIESLIEFTSGLVMPITDLQNDLISFSRPIPIVFLIGGFEGDDSQLWHLDPTGNYERCFIRAIGLNKNVARKHLEENYKNDLDLNETLKLCLRAMQKAVQVELLPKNIELLVIPKEVKQCIKMSEFEVALVLDSLQ